VLAGSERRLQLVVPGMVPRRRGERACGCVAGAAALAQRRQLGTRARRLQLGARAGGGSLAHLHVDAAEPRLSAQGAAVARRRRDHREFPDPSSDTPLAPPIPPSFFHVIFYSQAILNFLANFFLDMLIFKVTDL